MNLKRVSLYIPSGKALEQNARRAMAQIDKQLQKMQSVKKIASASDNFPGIYDNPFAFKPHIIG